MLKIDSKSRYLNNVAVFWYTEKGIVGFTDEMEGMNISDSGLFIELGDTHDVLWEKLISLKLSEDPYFYPRGRVIFDKTNKVFKVVCDPKLARSATCREELIQVFSLPSTMQFATDIHYRSECNNPVFAEYKPEEKIDPFEE